MNRSKMMGLALVIGAVALVIFGVFHALRSQTPPYELTATFEQAAGLKPGDNVTMRGLAIGQVIDVDLARAGVAVLFEIKPRFAPRMDAAATFRIESEKLVTGKQMLVVTPGEPPGEPLHSGASVRGEATTPDPIKRAQLALTETVDHARDQTKGLGRAILNPDTLPPRTVGGTIDLDRPGRFRVRLLSVKVHPTTADGDDWDAMGAGDPDLLVQLWADNRQILLSDTRDGTLEASWSDLVSEPLNLHPGLSLKAKVIDVDTASNDEIGVIELSPTVADARSGRVFRLAGGRVAELRLMIEPVEMEESP